MSTRWEFSSLRELAIEQLHDIAAPVNQVALAKQFHIDEWLIPAYVTLCKRQELFTVEEGRMLGTDGLVMIAQLQKRVRDQWGNTANVDDAKIVLSVNEIFFPPRPKTPLGPSRA